MGTQPGLWGVLPLGPTSRILHTFTLLSMEPEAAQGLVGESATAVTYLRGGGGERQRAEGGGRQRPPSSWQRYRSDGCSQISPTLKSCRALQSRALLPQRRHYCISAHVHACTRCFCTRLIRGSKIILICSFFTGGCHGDHCRGRGGHLPVMLRQGVEQGPLVLHARTHTISPPGGLLVSRKLQASLTAS